MDIVIHLTPLEQKRLVEFIQSTTDGAHIAINEYYPPGFGVILKVSDDNGRSADITDMDSF